MYVCMCMAVTEAQVRSCLRAGARTVEEVSEHCEAGTGCGGCLGTVQLIVEGGSLIDPAPTPCERRSLPRTA